MFQESKCLSIPNVSVFQSKVIKSRVEKSQIPTEKCAYDNSSSYIEHDIEVKLFLCCFRPTYIWA